MATSKVKRLQTLARNSRRAHHKEIMICSSLCRSLSSYIAKSGSTEAVVGYKNGEYYERPNN